MGFLEGHLENTRVSIIFYCFLFFWKNGRFSESVLEQIKPMDDYSVTTVNLEISVVTGCCCFAEDLPNNFEGIGAPQNQYSTSRC